MSERRESLVRWAKRMAVGGLFAVGLAIGAQWGDQRGAERAQRFSVAWMANESAAATEVLSRGGIIGTHVIDGGYEVTIHVDGKSFAATSTVREAALLEAVAKWKDL